MKIMMTKFATTLVLISSGAHALRSGGPSETKELQTQQSEELSSPDFKNIEGQLDALQAKLASSTFVSEQEYKQMQDDIAEILAKIMHIECESASPADVNSTKKLDDKIAEIAQWSLEERRYELEKQIRKIREKIKDMKAESAFTPDSKSEKQIEEEMGDLLEKLASSKPEEHRQKEEQIERLQDKIWHLEVEIASSPDVISKKKLEDEKEVLLTKFANSHSEEERGKLEKQITGLQEKIKHTEDKITSSPDVISKKKLEDKMDDLLTKLLNSHSEKDCKLLMEIMAQLKGQIMRKEIEELSPNITKMIRNYLPLVYILGPMVLYLLNSV